MKIKKFLALLMAAAMVASFGATALAEDKTTATDSVEVTVDGKTIYVNTEIYSVTLPTAATLNLYLDPQGLLDIESGEDKAKELDELVGGKVAGPDAFAFVNNSAVPIKLTVTLTGKTAAGGEDAADGKATVTFVADPNLVEKNASKEVVTTHNMLLVATPAGANMPKATTAFAAAEKGIALTDKAIALDFALPAADYTIEYSGTKAEDRYDSTKYDPTIVPDTSKGSAIKLSGFINSNADWTDFVKPAKPSTVSVTAVFSYAKDDKAATYIDGSYYDTAKVPYLLKLADGVIDVDSPETPPAPEFDTIGFITGEGQTASTRTPYNFSKASDTVATVPFFFGDTDTTTVTATWGGSTALQTTDFEISGNNFILKSSGGMALNAVSASATPRKVGIKVGTTTYTFDLLIGN